MRRSTLWLKGMQHICPLILEYFETQPKCMGPNLYVTWISIHSMKLLYLNLHIVYGQYFHKMWKPPLTIFGEEILEVLLNAASKYVSAAALSHYRDVVDK